MDQDLTIPEIYGRIVNQFGNIPGKDTYLT